MKIGIDLMFLESENIYSDFVLELVDNLILEDKENLYKIYSVKPLNLRNKQGINTIIEKRENNKFNIIKDYFLFYKNLKNDKNDLVIFFKAQKPVFFKGNYMVFIPTLKDIYYQDFKNAIQKYKFSFLLDNALKKANRIICFDGHTRDELNERFNIKEKNISLLPGFFPINKGLEKEEDLKIDIKLVNNIKNDFFIYSFGDGIEKNIERLINVFKRFRDEEKKIDLVILCKEVSKNLYIRKIVIDNNLQKNIHFLGELEDKKKSIYYKNSLGIIFPSLYETFPFHLQEGIFFSKAIIASNSKNIKDIFGKNILYFSPISVNDMKEKIEIFLKKKNKLNYSDVFIKYNPENTVKKLVEIIKIFKLKKQVPKLIPQKNLEKAFPDLP